MGHLAPVFYPTDTGLRRIPVSHQQPTHAIFTFKLGSLTFKGEHMSDTMPSGSTASLSIAWIDAAGNPATVDGPTAWESSDEAVVTLEASADSLTATVTSVGPVGPVQVQATADADMGSGIKTITAICDINVIAGEAVGGTITFTPTA